ncbi:hypothetical protein V490_03128 [Pseudogymnoascus sp. VKM F-3557]|nr:hypothetical protein V490_03128 [Pseudogymnoascus sp. VKM F-3557]
MVGIGSLPTEILSDILSYVRQGGSYDDPFSTSPYLCLLPTVCKTWQQHVELQTFRDITLSSCELEAWSRMMTTSRRSVLKKITYCISMPPAVNEAFLKGEQFAEDVQEAAQRASASGIADLFMLLKKWEEDSPLMSLSLDIRYSCTYSKLRRSKMERRGELLDPTGQYASNTSSAINAPTLDNLPNLKSVKRLYITGQCTEYETTESILKIAAKLSALTILDLSLDDMEWVNLDEELVSKFRYAFAVSLLPLASLPLTKFSISSYTDLEQDYYQHEEAPSTLHPISPEVDFLSLALHAISTIPTLEEMKIDNFIISQQLFQPPAIIPTSSAFGYLGKTTPRWPHLRKYELHFCSMHPSGSWYFVKHPDDPHTYDENGKFRTYPDDKSMNDLLGAAGKAKRNMPSLQKLSLIAETGKDSWEFDATWLKRVPSIYRISSRPLIMLREAFYAGGDPYRYAPYERDWYPTKEVEDAWAEDTT